MNIDYLTINAMGYKQYKENTNVFVYYISTAVLFYYPIDFVLWCYNNNSNILNLKTNTNLRNLLNYYKSIYNSTELLETFSQVNKSSLTASLKMSIVDI